jgi:flavin-dependent dehydrogenase
MRNNTDANAATLENGSRIAVVGGGPTGSFFTIFALKMAKMIGKELQVTVFEPKDFTRDGPGGCNRCGGVISELLVQTLAVEGIILPDSVVQRGINSYRLHTENGSVTIATPFSERTIATVYRGIGPKGIIGKNKESFDNFLLRLAVQEGAVHMPVRVDRIEYRNTLPVIFSRGQEIQAYDLVAGTCGVNSSGANLFESLGFGYNKPELITAAIAELGMDRETISEYFGNSIHLFLLPVKDIRFAAMIPKGTYVTLCILGKNISAQGVDSFLSNSVVKRALPEKYEINCRCLPKMNVAAPKTPFADRIVMCGDAGSTRLFKDGIGAAYLMGKAAAKTAVFHGAGSEHFRQHYYPCYRSLILDNYFGKFLYAVTEAYKTNKALCRGMLRVVRKEQKNPDKPKRLSTIMWDIFTGNERYKNIFFNSLSPRMNLEIIQEVVKAAVR